MCSTPFGIYEVVTRNFVLGCDCPDECSTPFGICEVVTAVAAIPVAVWGSVLCLSNRRFDIDALVRRKVVFRQPSEPWHHGLVRIAFIERVTQQLRMPTVWGDSYREPARANRVFKANHEG